MGKKKTHEEYIKQVSEINSHIEVVEAYTDAKTKILHKCKIDGCEWRATPNNVLGGHGCPECARKLTAQKLRKTHEEYIKKVTKINPNIEVLGEYVKNSINILHRCKIDGYKWMARPANILTGYGCPMCSGSIKKTREEYVNELKDINSNIEVLGEYVDRHTKILHKCKVDGHEWHATPSHILNGTGCPICSKISQIQKRRKSHCKYISQVNVVNPNIEVIGEYINSQTKILHKCRFCGYQWYIVPNNILNGQGCPKCCISHGEKDIENYLVQHNISYINQYKFNNCRNKRPLPFDFYLPEYNICIEYDGVQHFEPTDFAGRGELWANKKLEQIQYNDEIKNRYCKDNNIILLRIKYNEDIKNALDDVFNKQKIIN